MPLIKPKSQEVHINGKLLDINISSIGTPIKTFIESELLDKMTEEMNKEIDKKILNAMNCPDNNPDSFVANINSMTGSKMNKEEAMKWAKFYYTQDDEVIKEENKRKLDKYIADTIISHMLAIVDLYSKLNIDMGPDIFKFREHIMYMQKCDFNCEAIIGLLVEDMEILTKFVNSQKEIKIEADDFELIDI